MSKLFKKHKRLFSSKALKPLIVVFVLGATSAIVYAATYTSSNFFKSSTGTTITVAEHSVGKNVANSSGKNYFIPTKTATEWSRFVSNVPSLPGISLSDLSWSEGGFGSCSVSCGDGTKTQNVTCVGSNGAVVVDSYCTGTKPPTSQICNLGPCITYSWQPDGTYGTCSNGSYNCGPGTKPTIYKCQGSDTGWYPDNYCSGAGVKPVASVACTINNTVCHGTQEFMYNSSTSGVGTFIVPNGVTQATVTVIGGGGGGGGGDGHWVGGGGGGGGAGGFVSNQIVTGLSTGMVVPIKTGRGGNGGFGGGNNQGGLKGGDGTSSAFNGGYGVVSVPGVAYLTAYGGIGGDGAPCGSLSCVGVGGAAGTVSSQAIAGVSMAGSSGVVSTGPPYIYGAGGKGGATFYQPIYWYFFGTAIPIGGSGGGVGAPGGTTTNGGYCYSADNGGNGTVYGAGGGGGNSAYYGNGTTGVPGPNCAGGNGAHGYVKVVW